jgi:selenide,water dikinase
MLATAAKNEQADPTHLAAAVASMKQLNAVAARAAVAAGVRAGTDVTGFGLLGHADEIAEKSGVGLTIESATLPWLDGARQYAAGGVRTGGNGRNHAHFAPHVTFAQSVAEDLQTLLWESETSGGLLLCVPPEKVSTFLDACGVAGQSVWRIGTVHVGADITVR